MRHLRVPGRRVRQVTWIAWAACGYASPAVTVTTLRIRFSMRPWARPPETCPAGTSFHGGDLSWRSRQVALDQEGDRLRRFRALLPCEVVVTAVTHPLHGSRLRAYALRHVDGVPHLKVELPDGMPGLVAPEATDVLGGEAAGAGEGLVLDAASLRRLRAVVMRLRHGDASGPRR